MRKNVFYSIKAENVIGDYYENYIGTAFHNDMVHRAFRVSRIRACMPYLEVFLDYAYTIGGRNYVKIEDFAVVEYVEVGEDIFVINIYFQEL